MNGFSFSKMAEERSIKKNKTEKEKMMAGELYQAFDSELLKERNQAKQLCFEFNQTSPLDLDKRMDLLEKLLGGVNDAIIESPFNVDYGYNLKVGKNFYANHGCTILDCNEIQIGDNCLLAPHVCISAATHPVEPRVRSSGAELTAPIIIGDNVWIGANATICPGVTIGHGVVVGAGAVVTSDMPNNVVCGGVPAKIIRHILNEGHQQSSGGGKREVVLAAQGGASTRTVAKNQARLNWAFSGDVQEASEDVKIRQCQINFQG